MLGEIDIPSAFRAAQAIRPDLAEHIVAVKPISGEWPMGFRDKIKAARDRYDAGFTELTQGRCGEDLIVLYEIPRKVKDVPRYFFRRAPGAI